MRTSMVCVQSVNQHYQQHHPTETAIGIVQNDIVDSNNAMFCICFGAAGSQCGFWHHWPQHTVEHTQRVIQSKKTWVIQSRKTWTRLVQFILHKSQINFQDPSWQLGSDITHLQHSAGISDRPEGVHCLHWEHHWDNRSVHHQPPLVRRWLPSTNWRKLTHHMGGGGSTKCWYRTWHGNVHWCLQDDRSLVFATLNGAMVDELVCAVGWYSSSWRWCMLHQRVQWMTLTHMQLIAVMEHRRWLEACFVSLRDWCSSWPLQLNPDNTELI